MQTGFGFYSEIQDPHSLECRNLVSVRANDMARLASRCGSLSQPDVSKLKFIVYALASPIRNELSASQENKLHRFLEIWRLFQDLENVPVCHRNDWSSFVRAISCGGMTNFRQSPLRGWSNLLIGDEEACNSSRENSSFYRITQKASHWLHANNLRGYMGRTKVSLHVSVGSFHSVSGIWTATAAAI